MSLIIYEERSDTQMYKTTFEDLVAIATYQSPVAIPIGGKSALMQKILEQVQQFQIGWKDEPIRIQGDFPDPIRAAIKQYASSKGIPVVEVKSAYKPVEVKSARMPVEQGLTTVGKSGPVPLPSASMIQNLGITTTGLFFAGNKHWVPDSERKACALCNKTFNAGRRKHHCRQCGDIFCDDCSKGRKVVVHPASGSPKTEKAKEEVRVCSTCLSLGQI
jgi:hypothetical protein